MNTWFNYFFGDWKGNIGRIEDIDRNYRSVLVKYAHSFLQNEDKSISVVNDAFNAAYKLQQKFKSNTEIFLFISSFIRESCIAILKEMMQEAKQERILDENINELILFRGNEKYFITKPLRDAVHEEIEKLTRERKQVFKLFFCGLKNGEVAYMVGRKITTVKNLKRKTSIALFKALQNRGVLISQNSQPGISPGFLSGPEA